MSNKRSASARQAELRSRRRERLDAGRQSWSDGVFGIEVRDLRPSGGRLKSQLRWTVDPDDPHGGLMALHRLRTGVLASMELDLVENARDFGYSWQEIGWCLEITGEAARLRFGQRLLERGSGA